jgi:hypothetical protein
MFPVSRRSLLMPRPDASPDPHPIPRQRLVILTAFDQRYSKAPIEALLKGRGIDPTLPYTTAVDPASGDTVYTQDVPEETAP